MTYQMDRLTFGDCCFPFIAVFATRKVAEDYGEEKEETVQAIKENVYVNDYLDSCKSVEDAIERARNVDGILKQGDFHLTKWLSNAEEFNVVFQQNTGEKRKKEERGKTLSEEVLEAKILGFLLETSLDVITYHRRRKHQVHKKRVIKPHGQDIRPFGTLNR